jgi:hypothetical protein
MEIYMEASNEEEAPPPSYDFVVATQWLLCMCVCVCLSFHRVKYSSFYYNFSGLYECKGLCRIWISRIWMPGETKKQQSDHNADISLSECEDRIYHNFSNRKISFRSWTRKKVVFFSISYRIFPISNLSSLDEWTVSPTWTEF